MSGKIVFFAGALHTGGTAMVMAALAEALIARGVPVEVVVVKREGNHLAAFEKKAIPVVGLNAASRNGFPVRALRRYLQAEQPRALVAMGGMRNAIAIVAKLGSKTDTKIIVSENGVISYDNLKAGRWRITKTLMLLIHRLSAVLLYRHADHAVAISRHTARWMEKMARLKSGSVTVIYNPVYSSALIEQSQAAVPHPWLANAQAKVVLAAGRLHPVKDFALLIQAFHQVRQRMDCRLIILGDGPEKERLAALIRELHLENDVHMAGFVENPYSYMSRAAALVVPSKSEGLSNVLIEAMACGCQVIATDCPGGIREVLEDGRYGPLVPVGDGAALADALFKTLSGEYRIEPDTLVARARQFSVEASVKAYEALAV